MIILIAMLLSFQVRADDVHPSRLSTPTYYSQAYGEMENKSAGSIHPWPITVLSIGHTNASYQNYGGQPYFHHGLDIRANAGEDVFASAGGKVVNIENYAFGELYWEVAILDDEGFLWQYHHVDRNSIPAEIHVAFKNGGSIAAGAKIGQVVNWPITTYGERYHHIHLNILDGRRRYVSPFLFLDPLADTVAPVIQRIGLLKNGREVRGNKVSGTYSLYAEITDLILHDKFLVPPHLLQVEIDGAPARTVWNFEMLPGGADEEAQVDKFYVASMVCGNYNCRKPVIDLGFLGAFPTTAGTHTVRVRAWDFAGLNVAQDFQWLVE
jgi:hypothetical protein